MTTENSSQDSAGSSASTSDSSASSQTPSSQDSNQTTSTASAESASSQPGADAASIAPPVYQPNYKFKAFGKEHEIEETFRSLIKDKDTEEKIRKFHEKAYAMEKFQADEKKVRGEYDSFKNQTEPTVRAFNQFNKLLQNKDWDNFFGGLKVPEDEIFNWVEKRLSLRAMPPEQRAEFERQAQIREQNYAYEHQLQETQQNYQRLASETRSMQLENLLGRQDVSHQIEAIDRAYGQVGAARNLIIEEAVNHYHRTGEDLPADQAVQLALSKYGRFLAQNQSAQGSSMPVQAGAPQATPQGGAPIIPHVGGSARSPVKKSPRSLADLKELAARAEKQN